MRTRSIRGFVLIALFLLASSSHAARIQSLDFDLGQVTDSWITSKNGFLLAALWTHGRAGKELPSALKTWDLATGTVASEMSGQAYLTMSASGRFLLVSDSMTGEVSVFSVSESGGLQPEINIGKVDLEEFNGSFRNLPQFSPDDRYLAVFDKSGEMRVFDLSKKSLVQRLVGISGGKFSPDSSRLLVSGKTADNSCELQLLTLSDGQLSGKALAHPWICGPRFEEMAAFSPDSKFFFSTQLLEQNEYGEETRRVFLRRADSGDSVAELQFQSENGRKYRITFSSDSRYLAATFSTICVASDYDCFQSGSLIRTSDGARLESVLGKFAHLQFSNDGRYALARSYNDIEKMVDVRAWDLVQGTKIAEFRQHPAWFTDENHHELPQWVSAEFDPRMMVIPNCLGDIWDLSSCYVDVWNLTAGMMLYQSPASGTLRFFMVSPDSKFAVIDKNLLNLANGSFRVIPLLAAFKKDLLDDEKTELRFTPGSKFLRVLGPKGLNLFSLNTLKVTIDLSPELLGRDRYWATVRRSDDDVLVLHPMIGGEHSRVVRVYRLK